MKIPFLVYLFIGAVIVLIVGNYTITHFLTPVPTPKIIEQKNIDCNICLESQYLPCNAPDKDCWIVIDNIHQVCYQNCTIQMENR